MNTADDFVDLVLKSHILSATITLLNIKEMDETPSSFTANLTIASCATKKQTLDIITNKVVDTFVNIRFFSSPSSRVEEVDEVYKYVRETLSLLQVQGCHT